MEELNRLEKSLLQHVGKAVHDFSLIDEGDRIMVAISGGKDSYTMLHLLRVLQVPVAELSVPDEEAPRGGFVFERP